MNSSASAERFVLGLDLGTTGVRSLLYASNGELVASAYLTFLQYYPKPGWVEHDPEEIYIRIRQTIQKACRSAHCQFSQVSAVGITNQRETIVLWDKKTSKPVAPAIVWQDRRTEYFCTNLKKKGLEKIIRKKTGLVLDPYFSATKINWLLENTPGLRKKALAGSILAGTIDSWVLWRLTGEHATDSTNASRTLLFDIHRRRWDRELLKIFNIPEVILPKVLPSGGLFGKTVKQKGISSGVPVFAVLGDQQASLYGQSCVRLGEVKNTYGTGCFMMMNAGQKKPKLVKGLLTTLAAGERGKPTYAYEGSVFIAGAVIQWLRDELKLIDRADETDRLARSVPDTHGMIFIPAFVGLGSPYWRSDIRGSISGLTRGVTRAHFVRAALESIAQQSADVLEAMQKTSRVSIDDIRVDGKAAQNHFLMQYQSDLIGLPIRVATHSEVTAWGVIRLAGEMIGFWKPGLKLDRILKYKVYYPSKSKSRRASAREAWKKAIGQLI